MTVLVTFKVNLSIHRFFLIKNCIYCTKNDILTQFFSYFQLKQQKLDHIHIFFAIINEQKGCFFDKIKFFFEFSLLAHFVAAVGFCLKLGFLVFFLVIDKNLSIQTGVDMKLVWLIKQQQLDDINIFFANN